MKKILLLSVAVCLFMAANAQVPAKDYSGKVLTEKTRFNSELHKKALKMQNQKTSKSRWYNYAFTMDDILGTSAFAWNMLFPDTTILVNYASGYDGPWIHLLGNTLDPSSEWFNDDAYYSGELQINSHMPFTVDSIQFYCYYWRELNDPSVVDTLVVEVYTDNDPADAPRYYFGPSSSVAGSYGTDTLKFIAYEFNGIALNTKISAAKIYKIPLTEALANDTMADGSLAIKIATGDLPPVNANGVVLSTFRFVPGYSWTPFLDTLVTMNAMRFVSYEENGTGTWSNYTKGDWNASHIGTTEAAFYSTSSWYEMQIPEWAYSSESFAYENHVVSYLLTADETGMEKVTDNILALSQNQPNPFSNSTTISYTLTESADVTFELFDQTGKKVSQQKLGIEGAGMHTIEVDATNLNNGIYFYTLTAGNFKASKKMVVLK